MAFIKAIETRAYGCRFRSRAEARWATLFNHMKWQWEYEPQGVQLPAGNYLPDFRLSVTGAAEPIWFEVKPGSNNAEDARWWELATASEMVVIVARGMHRTSDHCERDHSATAYTPGVEGGRAILARLWQKTVPQKAWDTASSARFEFGETG
jgi:hypothetical protein